MITAIDIANFCIPSIGITIAAMGLTFAIHAQFMDKWYKKYFILLFSIVILYAAFAFTSEVSLVLLGPNYAALSRVAICLESLSSSLLMPLFTIFILHVCGQSLKCGFMLFNTVLWCIYFILLMVTQFTTFIYYITSDNVYMRGPFYPVLLLPALMLLISNLIGIYLRKELFSPRLYRSSLIYMLIPLITMFMQMFSYGLLLIVLGTSISAMIIFMNILNEQIARNIAQSKEIANQQLAIRTLQMRPHFIYNTLTNIYYLCQQDSKKAQLAIENFTRYLRKNFTAITKEELIPFDEELDHARAYLSVVKIRFEELLFVEYDTPFTDFKLPPLTLEPIVENCVKHNLDPDSSPLNILIKTEKKGDHAIITVEDNGNGYVATDKIDKILSGDYTEDHIGLSNVKNRLEEMCGGTLDIAPRNDDGATVTITVPI